MVNNEGFVTFNLLCYDKETQGIVDKKIKATNAIVKCQI